MLNYSFIVPIINGGEQLTTQLNSFPDDVLPEKIFIIDNSCGKDVSIKKAIENISTMVRLSNSVEIHTPIENLGCSASWNLGFRNTSSPWIVANSDLFLNDSFGITNILHLLSESDMCLACGLSLFGITNGALDKAGTFDENFYPAYNEDMDYVTRLSLMGGKITQFAASVIHEHSSSLKNDRRLAEVIGQTHQMNDSYYIKKWGSKNRYTNRYITDHVYCDFEHPFNDPSISPKEWVLDEAFISEKKRIFNRIMGC